MSLSQRLGPRLHPLALALCFGLGVAVAGGPADAVEAPPGSKNFTPPPEVPNYFSNESGPFHSGAIARSAEPGAVPMVAAPASRDGHAVASRRAASRHHPAHLAKATGRTRLAHGKVSAHRQVAHAGAARRGHAAESKIAHAGATRRGHAAEPKIAHAGAARHGHAAEAKVAHAGAARRSHAAEPKVTHAGAARRGHAAEPKVAHAPVRHIAGKTIAAKSHAASSKAKHPARAHG